MAATSELKSVLSQLDSQDDASAVLRDYGRIGVALGAIEGEIKTECGLHMLENLLNLLIVASGGNLDEIDD